MPGNMWDRVCETSTSTGTGDFTLAGAIAGYRTFNSVVSSAYTFYYLIEAVNSSGVATGQWEIGIGYMSSAVNFQRQVPIESSTGALVSFSAGTKRVYMTAPAYQLGALFRRVGRSTDLTAQNFTTATAISWGANQWNTTGTTLGLLSSFYDSGGAPTKFTIPASFESAKIRMTGQVALANVTANEWVELKFRIDAGTTYIGRQTFQTGSTSPTYNLVSQIYDIAALQTVELMIQTQADTSIDLLAANSFFQIEILQ